MEMVGINAWNAMACVGYRARIALEILPEDHSIPVLVNDQHKSLAVQEVFQRDKPSGYGYDARHVKRNLFYR